MRELKNFAERMMIMHPGQEVGPEALPEEFRDGRGQALGRDDAAVPPGPVDMKEAKARLEARIIAAKLDEFGGNVSKVAEALGLERSSLYRKLKAYGLQGGE